jgi:hypothetical protein
MKLKCAFCGVVLEDDCDIVYGLFEMPKEGEEEKFFDCRFCRDSWISLHKRD